MYDRYQSPRSERYASKEMQYIFSPDKKFKTWRKLWIALAETEYELGLLQDAYNMTMTKTDDTELTQEEYILYGSYEPLSVTITHILNNKSGIDFSSYSHTGLPVAVFAMGAGQELFEGYYDNTDIYFNLAELTGVA